MNGELETTFKEGIGAYQVQSQRVAGATEENQKKNLRIVGVVTNM